MGSEIFFVRGGMNQAEVSRTFNRSIDDIYIYRDLKMFELSRELLWIQIIGIQLMHSSLILSLG